jgi:CBS-domain-containing membrane protein
VPTFADRGYHVVSVTDAYGRIIGFLVPDYAVFIMK